jgi:hypothetical protein
MIAFIALVVGYVIGAKAGSKDLDDVVGSLRRLSQSEEFADVVTAVRSHVGHTLRELGSVVEGASGPAAEEQESDLVARVRHLVARDG